MRIGCSKIIYTVKIIFSSHIFANNITAFIFGCFLTITSTPKFCAMNKGELIEKIAKDAKLTKVQAGDALDSFINTVGATLAKNGKITLVGFGTYSVSKRAARKGRNPRTGKEITIKAKKVAKFKAGTELSKKVNK